MNKNRDPDLVPQVKEEPFNIYAATAPDWRVWLGLALTIVWLLLLSFYIAGTVGWVNVASAPINIVGNFLEGAFAPLAFLWLVIGYFLQKKEITQNTAAIKMQYVEIQKTADQAVMQTEAIAASEQHARSRFCVSRKASSNNLARSWGFCLYQAREPQVPV